MPAVSSSKSLIKMVAKRRIELPTRGFVRVCSATITTTRLPASIVLD